MCTPISRLGDRAESPLWELGVSHGPESRAPSPGQGAGPSHVSPAPVSGRTPGCSPSQVSGQEAAPKRAGPTGPRGPDPASPHRGPAPGSNGRAACDPGPRSREFRADAASPHSGPGAHWLRRGPRGRDLSGPLPQLPWVSGRCPALGEEPALFLGLPRS